MPIPPNGRDGRFLLNPAWYGAPMLLFALVATGAIEAVRGVGPVVWLSGWLAKQSAVWQIPLQTNAQAVPGEYLVKGVSLLLLPLAVAGVFHVLWRIRHVHVELLERRGEPIPRATEFIVAALFLGVLYINYFMPASAKCAFCPAPTSISYAALEAGTLFFLSLMPCIVCLTGYARLQLRQSKH